MHAGMGHWNPQKPAKQDGNDTTHLHHPYTSCAILPTKHNKKLSTHSLNEHGIQHCSLHSLPHKRKSILPHSAAINFHNIKLPTYHADPALLTVSA